MYAAKQEDAEVKDPYIGQVVADQFRILERVGAGGMGAVYRAVQPEMNRFVAVKILHARYLERPDLVSRFRREAKAMSHLSHPNTAKVFLAGQFDDGTLYYVMEYLEGRTLEQTVRAQGPMQALRMIRIMVPICGALEEAHRAGIIHRDLKPENIFLTEHGGIKDFPKLLDFGLAKVTEKQMGPGSVQLTRRGMVFGTREFMSPEQALGDELDARSDIYSLGVVMYEALTGKLPFRVSGNDNYLAVQVRSDPIPVGERVSGIRVPDVVGSVVMKAIERDPGARPSTAFALQIALEAAHESLAESIESGSLSLRPASEASVMRPLQLHNEEDEASRPTDIDHSKAPIRRASERLQPSRMPWVVFASGLMFFMLGLCALAYALLLR